MKSFSQRRGIKPVSELIQTSSMTGELRNSLWNAVQTIWAPKFLGGRPDEMHVMWFAQGLWANYFREAVDDMPKSPDAIVAEIRKRFFAYEWNEVYDFIENSLNYDFEKKSEMIEYMNFVLEREMSAFRIIEDEIVEISNELEREMLEEAFADNEHPAVRTHLQQAFTLLSHRDNPDYRNSIKESISAVESIAKTLSGNPKLTLGEAIKVIKKDSVIHPSLLDAFSKIYGYTNDESGIRHALMDLPNLNQDDAKYFLLTCTSFVNYLKATYSRKGAE